MKKIAAVMMLLCLLLSMTSVASADTLRFKWGSKNSYVGIQDAKLSRSGNGKKTSVFFVTATSKNAQIKLSQSKGTCSLLSYTKFLSGLKGTAKEWGKYEIRVVHAESHTLKVYRWNKTYNNGTYTIKLPKTGRYYVIVRPYTSQEMTKSYLCDIFAGWTKAPQWNIKSYSKCQISVVSPWGR